MSWSLLVVIFIILGALCGALTWNLITWYSGFPSSSSHALIGGFTGAAVAKAGFGALLPSGLLKILAFIVLAPVLGLCLRFTLLVGTFWMVRGDPPKPRRGALPPAPAHLRRLLQPGPRDQRRAEDDGHHLLRPLLGDHGRARRDRRGHPHGGWRIVKTTGMRLTKLRPIGGFCAETAGAVMPIGTAVGGIPVSTTHTITGSIMGVGATQRLSAVRWGVAGEIVWAWVLTIPLSALIAAAVWGAIALILARLG